MTPFSERIVIQQGDLTEMDVDAIVNAANNDLNSAAGVAGAIQRKGGDAIQRSARHSAAFRWATRPSPAAGKLKARHVIHAASMARRIRTTAKRLQNVDGTFSVLLPNTSSKPSRFPPSARAFPDFRWKSARKTMLAEVVKHLKAGSSLETVYFVLFDSAACDVFQLIWQQLQKDLTSGAASA